LQRSANSFASKKVLLAGLATLFLSGRDASHALPRLPLLEVREASEEDRKAAGKPNWLRAFELALPNLDDTDRNDLRAILEQHRTRLEARLSPLGSDLFDGDPRDALAAWARVHGLLVQTAAALSTRSWMLADGVHVVSLVDACGSRCVPLWGTADADRPVRLAAWAWSEAMLLRVEDREARSCVRHALRQAARERASLALVVAGEEDAATTEDERALVRDVLAMEAMRSSGSIPVEEKARPSIPEPVLGPADLLCVPRLAAITDLATFASQIEARVRSCSAEAVVVHAPVL
jgi:hypothetical protein